MKQLVFFLFLSAIVFPSRAQEPSKKELAFLDALNRLVIKTKHTHWHYDKPIKVGSAIFQNRDNGLGSFSGFKFSRPGIGTGV